MGWTFDFFFVLFCSPYQLLAKRTKQRVCCSVSWAPWSFPLLPDPWTLTLKSCQCCKYRRAMEVQLNRTVVGGVGPTMLSFRLVRRYCINLCGEFERSEWPIWPFCTSTDISVRRQYFNHSVYSPDLAWAAVQKDAIGCLHVPRTERERALSLPGW